MDELGATGVGGPLRLAAGVMHAPLVPIELLERAQMFARSARAKRTRDVYRYQWVRFETWCEVHACTPLPASPATLVFYLTAWADAGGSLASLAQALAAISEAHAMAGHQAPRRAPELREVWKGIRRELGRAPRRRAAPMLVEDLRQIAALLSDSRIGRRDRALLTIGFTAALRRSELVALDVADARLCAEGIELRIRRSKTDQEGAGAIVGVPFGNAHATCPVRSLRAWLEEARIDEGAIFRAVNRYGLVGSRLSDRAVAKIVKCSVLRAGLDPSAYSGHSLRAGLATSAARAGKRDRAIMRQGRWRSRSMVDRYVREATLLDDDNAAAGIGL